MFYFITKDVGAEELKVVIHETNLRLSDVTRF